MTERFPMNATTYEEATEYLVNRAIQLLAEGYTLEHISPLENWGVRALFKHEHDVFQSVYVLAPIDTKVTCFDTRSRTLAE